MSKESNLALVKRLFDEGWNGGDVTVVDAVVAPNAKAHGKEGRQAWKDAIAFYRGLFPDLHYTVEEMFAGDDDRVVVRWAATATDTVGMGMPPTGKTATVTGINIYRVENGRLAEHCDEWDLYGLLAQLGAVPRLAEMP